MSEQEPASDLFDLRMLPAWVKESPDENRYADFAGEENVRFEPRERRGGERQQRGPRPVRRDQARPERRAPEQRRPPEPRREENFAPPPPVDLRFVPDARALENVLAQIKSSHLAYSVFSLARMFLEKPERYDVKLKALSGSIFQMGDNGPVAGDRRLLENNAFAREQENFYRTETTQTDPIKGNFTTIARDRLSGTLLGPTNHHAYQQKLRALYEQRFSRRMNFADFQRQIEIVSDPAVVERWKEEARSVTTFVTTQEEPPQTFANAAEAERHFRQNYLPRILQERSEAMLDGVVSRRLPDRSLGRLIEDAWAQEMRSPSKMMQELISAFPANGLHIFRHRKTMLFVSPVRPKPLAHQSISLSPSVASLVRLLGETPGANRKQLLEKILGAEQAELSAEEVEKRKRAIASDLRWLIREGNVIEFNDGTLDLARGKTAAPSAAKEATPPNESAGGPPVASPNEPAEDAATLEEATAPGDAEAKSGAIESSFVMTIETLSPTNEPHVEAPGAEENKAEDPNAASIPAPSEPA